VVSGCDDLSIDGAQEKRPRSESYLTEAVEPAYIISMNVS
jgi:hypothetical protein